LQPFRRHPPHARDFCQRLNRTAIMMPSERPGVIAIAAGVSFETRIECAARLRIDDAFSDQCSIARSFRAGGFIGWGDAFCGNETRFGCSVMASLLVDGEKAPTRAASRLVFC
jgi:hypothetical protein